jgi:hypothetical protein
MLQAFNCFRTVAASGRGTVADGMPSLDAESGSGSTPFKTPEFLTKGNSHLFDVVVASLLL